MPTAKVSDFAFTHFTGHGWYSQILTVKLALTDLKPLWVDEEFNSNTTRAWLTFKATREDWKAPFGYYGVFPQSAWLEVRMNRSDFDQTATLLREHSGHLFAGWAESPDVTSIDRDPFVLSTDQSEIPSQLWMQKPRGNEPPPERRAPAATAPATTAESLLAASLLNRLLTERDRPETTDDDDELSRRLGSLVLRSLIEGRPG